MDHSTASSIYKTERSAQICVHLYIYDWPQAPRKVVVTKCCQDVTRIQRWLLPLQSYNYTVTYAPGYSNPADYLSWNPTMTVTSQNQIALIHCDSIGEEYINSILSQNIPRSMTTNEIQEHSGKDQVLQRVIAAVKTKKWDKNQQPCYGIQDQPSVVENLLLKEH